MQLNLKLEDKLYDHYLQKFGSPMHYRAMKRAVEAFKDIDTGKDRFLLLHGDDRRAIEAIFQTTLDDPAKLIKLIKNMCTFKIGEVEVQFTSEQLARMDMQAKFHGRTTEQYIKETVTELLARFMEEI